MTNTVQSAITVLNAITADALKAIDDATLDRLAGLTDECWELIADEKERRDPESAHFDTAFEKMEEYAATRIAEHRAWQEATRATLQRAIELCASSPALQARLKAMMP